MSSSVHHYYAKGVPGRYLHVKPIPVSPVTLVHQGKENIRNFMANVSAGVPEKKVAAKNRTVVRICNRVRK